jgi:hypothetical protein
MGSGILTVPRGEAVVHGFNRRVFLLFEEDFGTAVMVAPEL